MATLPLRGVGITCLKSLLLVSVMINVQSYHHCLSKEQFKSGNKIPTLLTLYVHGIKVHQERHTAELELNEL